MTKTKKKEKLLTISEAAEKANRAVFSIQAVIKKGSLLAKEDPKTKQLMIEEDELDRYANRGRELSHRRSNGELVYDKEKGEHTMAEAAEILGLEHIDLYHEINSPTNNLKYSVKGKNYKIFHIEDIGAYQKLLKERTKSKKR
jgi:hypothetical protein